jgi:hypothetical protein
MLVHVVPGLSPLPPLLDWLLPCPALLWQQWHGPPLPPPPLLPPLPLLLLQQQALVSWLQEQQQWSQRFGCPPTLLKAWQMSRAFSDSASPALPEDP